jgi:TPR repeat protein
MNFCPYCGYQIKPEAVRNRCLEQYDGVDNCVSNGNYRQLLDRAMSGDMYAMFCYVQHISSQSRTSVPDRTNEYDMLKEMALKSVPFAMTAYAISIYYENRERSGLVESFREGIKYNQEKVDEAFKLVNQAVNIGEPVAQYELWLWDENIKDDARAYKLVEASAKQEYPPAMYTLGMWHYEGTHGARKDAEKGYALIEKAAIYKHKKAIEFFKEADSHWDDLNLQDEFDDKLTQLAIGNLYVKNKSSEVKKSKSQEEREEAQKRENDIIEEALDACISFDTCVHEYKKLAGMKFYIVDQTEALYSIKEKMEAFAQVSGNSLEETIMLKEQLDKCKQEIFTYKLLDDFTKLRSWGEQNDINEKALHSAFAYGSNVLKKKFNNEIQQYREYKAKKPGGIFGVLFGLVFWLAVAVIVNMIIIKVIAWIGVIGSIGIIFSEHRIRSYKKTYLKIEQLVKMGYTVE